MGYFQSCHDLSRSGPVADAMHQRPGQAHLSGAGLQSAKDRCVSANALTKALLSSGRGLRSDVGRSDKLRTPCGAREAPQERGDDKLTAAWGNGFFARSCET